MSHRGKRQKTARMRERIDIQTATTDESTGQPIRTFATTYAREPAQWTPTTGGEFVNGKLVEANINAVFTIHRRDYVTPETRVVHGTQAYGIAYVHPVEGMRRYLDLHCKAIENTDVYSAPDGTVTTPETVPWMFADGVFADIWENIGIHDVEQF